MTQPTYHPAPAAPRQKPQWLWIAGLFAALVLGFAIGTTVAVETRNTAATTNTPDPSGTANPVVAPPVTTTTTTTTTTTQAPMPTPQDFTIAIKVTQKKCFGSAGCNVSYQIEPKYVGANPLPTGKRITVVYEVTGGDDPQVNRFTIQDDTARFDEEESIQTPNSSAELTATITQII